MGKSRIDRAIDEIATTIERQTLTPREIMEVTQYIQWVLVVELQQKCLNESIGNDISTSLEASFKEKRKKNKPQRSRK